MQHYLILSVNCQILCRLGGIECRKYVAQISDREQALRLPGRDFVDADTVSVHERRQATHLVNTLFVAGDLQITHIINAGGNGN